MTDSNDLVLTRLRELRESFDSSFAEPPLRPEAPGEMLLAVRVASKPHALRMSEIAAVEAGRAITRLPSSALELLGLARIAGRIAAIYDLGALLGYARTESPRWLALASGGQVAFAFDELEAQLRIQPNEVSPGTHGHDAIRGLVQVDGQRRPLVHLPSLTRALEALAASRATEE